MDDDHDSSIWQRLKKYILRRSSESVEQLIDDASKEGELDQNERSMLINVLNLAGLQVQEIMTPRTDIISANCDASVQEIMALIVSSGHSRIPLYKENKDNFVGVVHAKDILAYCLKSEKMHEIALHCIRPVFVVPETKSVVDLLHEFQARKSHLAIILDEFGGTTGLITIEDVIEEIVGEIEDEHDTPKPEDIEKRQDGTFLILGRADLDDVNEMLSLEIDTDEVDTIGGYLSLLVGHVPRTDEKFKIGEYEFIVISADAKQVHSLLAVPFLSLEKLVANEDLLAD